MVRQAGFFVNVTSAVLEVDRAVEIGRKYQGPKKVVFVVNNDRSFLSHRATWGAALRAAGATITVIAEDTGDAAAIRKLGFKFVPVRVGRESSSVTQMAKSAIQILMALLKIRPNLVFLSAQVAYTLGWPAALLLRRTEFVRVAGGVGRGLSPNALRTRAGRVVRASGYMAGHLQNVFTLFQIEDDRQAFLRYGLIQDIQRTRVIPGTGIDVKAWEVDNPRNFEKPVIVFASRLYREKGVYEFVRIAEALRGRGWIFQLVGDPDHGVPSAVTEEEILRWRNDGAVEILGRRTDMADVLGQATMFVFPTQHPEGTPKVLIEAGASGVPSVVPRHPGCVAVVEDGVTGIVCKDDSATEWASAVERLASNPELSRRLGDAARERVAAVFSLQTVIDELFLWEPVGARRR